MRPVSELSGKGIAASDVFAFLLRVPFDREENLVISTADWNKRFALTVRDIVVTHGGAIVMTKDELIEAVLEQDDSFTECPQVVFDHPCLPLRSHALLGVNSFVGQSNRVVVIHYQRMPVQVARSRCKENGLSESVRIELLEMGVKLKDLDELMVMNHTAA